MRYRRGPGRIGLPARTAVYETAESDLERPQLVAFLLGSPSHADRVECLSYGAAFRGGLLATLEVATLVATGGFALLN